MTSTEARSLEMANTDAIAKEIVLRAPRSRVWRALTDSAQFGTWFRVKLEGPFEAGRTVRGAMTYPGHEGKVIELMVETIEPETVFVYRWHPYDPNVDVSKEPTTKVEFRLEDAAGGTKLSLVESGFDRLPASRRADAFRRNEGGWTSQLENIRRYVEG